VVGNEGLAAEKKITRKSSVAKGAMFLSWFLNQRERPPPRGAVVVSVTGVIKLPLRAAQAPRGTP